MPCIICGDPNTIEAHIFPRAFYRKAAGADQHAYEGSAFREGITFQAKGVFDPDLLCRSHEDAFKTADDYGFKFIRWFNEKGRQLPQWHAWLVPNPKPHLLVRFVAACIWRRSVSPILAESADLCLGNAERKFRDLLFNPSSRFDPPLRIRRRRFTSQGQELRELMWLPVKGTGPSEGLWSFYAFGCQFEMKVNPYSVPHIHPTFLANRSNPVWCIDSSPQELSTVEGMVDIATNMLRPSYRLETAKD